MRDFYGYVQKIDTSSRIKEIILSTGNVNRPYIVRDIVFAADKIEVDLFDPEIDLNALLSDVAFRLKEKRTVMVLML